MKCGIPVAFSNAKGIQTLANFKWGRYHSKRVDNLPKKTNDWSSFAGSYPDEQKKPEIPQAAAETVVPPVAAEPVPFAPSPSQQNVPETSPASPSGPESFVIGTNTPYVQTVPTDDTAVPSYTPTDGGGEAPFVAPTIPPEKPAGGGVVKRLLVMVILIVVLLVLGIVAFKIVGGLTSKNKPVTLSYWGLWEKEDIMSPIIAEFKQTHPTISIEYTRQNPRQYRERLQAALERGEGPDIFRYHNTWVPMLKNDLAAAGKTGYTPQEFQQIFYPVAQKDMIMGGKIYGVPLMFESLGLFYNEDLLTAAGVAPPTTWENFRESALALTVKDETGRIITSGAALGTTNNVEHFSDIIGVMMLQNGADIKNPVSKEAQDTLSFYRLFAETPNNVWDDTLDNSIIAFASGKVAMVFAPSWQVFAIKEMNPDLNFRVIPIPQLPGTSVTWASYWVEGVSEKSAHKDEAWEFLKFLSSKESLTTLYTEAAKDRLFGEPYSRVDLAQTLINDAYVGAFVSQAPTAQSFFLASRTFDNGINDKMIKYLEDAVNSMVLGKSAEAALETAGQGFQQVLSTYGYTSSAP